MGESSADRVSNMDMPKVGAKRGGLEGREEQDQSELKRLESQISKAEQAIKVINAQQTMMDTDDKGPVAKRDELHLKSDSVALEASIDEALRELDDCVELLGWAEESVDEETYARTRHWSLEGSMQLCAAVLDWSAAGLTEAEEGLMEILMADEPSLLDEE